VSKFQWKIPSQINFTGNASVHVMLRIDDARAFSVLASNLLAVLSYWNYRHDGAGLDGWGVDNGWFHFVWLGRPDSSIGNSPCRTVDLQDVVVRNWVQRDQLTCVVWIGVLPWISTTSKQVTAETCNLCFKVSKFRRQ